MTEDEYRAHGLHQCPDCLTLHASEKALLFCCDPAYDRPSFERGYD